MNLNHSPKAFSHLPHNEHSKNSAIHDGKKISGLFLKAFSLINRNESFRG